MPESIKMKFFHCFSTDKTASMESFARLLIAIPLVSYVLAVLSLWVGLQINSFIFPIAVCISVLWECSDRRIRGCVRWTTTVAVLVVLSVIRLYLRSVVRRSMVSCLYDSGVGERVESDLFFCVQPYSYRWIYCFMGRALSKRNRNNCSYDCFLYGESGCR